MAPLDATSALPVTPTVVSATLTVVPVVSATLTAVPVVSATLTAVPTTTIARGKSRSNAISQESTVVIAQTFLPRPKLQAQQRLAVLSD
ncbi:hypothetical protein PtA15_11A12 [Puccinia triticina]|uniref:Uncharacterized protein n=1 Tax=Puccinia triticina TaxID=208348 RepID=A0ABY7CXF1_9BASI|nr:uncharacterized protein PtA15_11A12 [Puccinia triticina]WAQ89325.1 hypothetical protein PtA15_11A12 [Puccinia triticina]